MGGKFCDPDKIPLPDHFNNPGLPFGQWLDSVGKPTALPGIVHLNIHPFHLVHLQCLIV